MNKLTKKLLVLFTALSMLLLNVPTFASAEIGPKVNINNSSEVKAFSSAGQPKFKDVPFTHWASYYIEILALAGVITGHPDGTFKPETSITRAEFATIFVNTFYGKEGLVEYEDEFKDVKAGKWYSNHIATAVYMGVISGYEDGTFKPDKSISRTEMAAIISSYLEDDVTVTSEETTKILSQFKDSGSIQSWARTHVAKLIKSGIMSGMSQTQFSPNGIATRAQSASVIYRLVEFYI
ncbi:S-layer domain-containing protein [Gottschalkia purinilytica]|uniref:S-layer domain-containing protein n=1 Tax=Gottschalkia purinilytica TaxID=1503 RepID=A0A0L0WDY4_GOTPU|nr:S-layer homology domain-containing protein [Gottschalkia purinilytica]KNF09688.1 S-layer domain-containing protein [Gottschalkia purinilytica]